MGRKRHSVEDVLKLLREIELKLTAVLHRPVVVQVTALSIAYLHSTAGIRQSSHRPVLHKGCDR